MGKDKLRRFRENLTFDCFVQPEFDEVFHCDHPLKGRWRSDFFRNDNPIVLELGCGKGEYTVALAEHDPSRNYIGIDIKGARMWRGAKSVTERKIANAGFLRTRVEFINGLFAENEVDEIWITFPDPQLKSRRAKKRLTSPLFLEYYARLLKSDGWINLKTDSKHLFAYTNAATPFPARFRIPTSTVRGMPTRCFRSKRPTRNVFSKWVFRSPIPAFRWPDGRNSRGSTGKRTKRRKRTTSRSDGYTDPASSLTARLSFIQPLFS